ncbi:MAG TPA: choice-of-anchor tandem repeat GloVer-containing protein [Terriglobia bacterium]|nr:choice-of-anchor tandem repeat GloVer-containing protein [Terriglobia bacterium]
MSTRNWMKSNLNWVERAGALFLMCAATAITLTAQTFTTLHSFDGTDGEVPWAVLQANDGNLYGTTELGGTNDVGTVFKITPSGTLTTVYSFCSQSGCTDGEAPSAPLVQATDGNFYGATYDGGANGDGTVFKITPSGTLTTLYSFCSQPNCADGALPFAAPVLATDGNLYGTTAYGGANGFYGTGTVFKLTTDGTLTTLYSFCSQSGCTDGKEPEAALVQATDGNFYGTTSRGGANGGRGTVFKITPSGALTRLYSFCSQSGCTDGAFPYTALVQATDGNFYGTTSGNGANHGGTVFKITPSGTLTTVYSFCSQSGCTDGELPEAALVQATDGNFYGTTYDGGANGYGTVFKTTPTGALTTLYSFCSQSNCADGDYPFAALVQATDGSFYGTTYGGGANGEYGTVFSVSVGLRPFVETQPTFGKVGKSVKILGTNLTGATSVTFNGTPAVFTVVSRSLIITTVPAGATTGTVRVTIPTGTLKSNLPFKVRP